MYSRRLIASLLVALPLLVLPCDAAAQTEIPKALTIAEHAVASPAKISDGAFRLDRLSLSAGVHARAAQSTQRGQSRDSLKNGVVLGAIVGAVALGGFGAAICKALQEPGASSCLGDSLRIAAVGAAIGAGAGLAVDAALTRQAGVRVSVRVRF